MLLVDNSDKFVNKFKLKSSRLKNWDYSSPGIYFITICSYNHNNFFGKIFNHQMELSKIGNVVKSELLKTFKIRKNIKLHEWIIMPNHIHILMEIKYQIKKNFIVETSQRGVSTEKKTINAIKKWKPNSISSIICQFKSICTKIIKKQNMWFSWQSRFHDEIIKDKKRYYVIKKYIQNNVKNWQKDNFYKN